MANQKAGLTSGGDMEEAKRPASRQRATSQTAGDGPEQTPPGAVRRRGAGTRSTAATNAASPTSPAEGAQSNLRADLRQFVNEHPDGWGHDEWLGLLDRLRERGHEVGNSEQIGMELERERLGARLERIQGVGPQRVRSLVDRFGTLWNLRHAGAEEIAQAAKIPQSLAERIRNEVQ